MKDIMAYDEAHYFDIGTEESPDIVLGGVITQLDESSNPTESEKQYIQQKTKTTNVTGFSDEFPITMDMVKGDEVLIYSKKKPTNCYHAKYMDMVVIPASMGEYGIINLGKTPCRITKTMLK